ncbi:MAG: hypothetical protein ABIO94_10935, partial [Opitutaceae bacterium]
KESKRSDYTEEQEERRLAIFGILISLFERAYLLVYEKEMDHQTKRLWQSWEDYMTEWLRHRDFRKALPTLLEGEDEEFSRYIQKLAERVDAETSQIRTVNREEFERRESAETREPR